MDPREIITKKRDGERLTEAEIDFLVSCYSRNIIPDYQMAAFLMAVVLRGMDERETIALTKSMRDSGEVLDLSDIPGPNVDKHSTGGVGDKVSLVLAPLVAACGIVVPMVSGRGLGHTGGTLDKLEAIPGFRTNLSTAEFKRQLADIGVAMIGQTQSIAPADKKIYALRDVTGTVESIPLICASILSKKLASGAEGIVFDIKVGSGAFMKTRGEATRLAKGLRSLSRAFGKKTAILFTGMDEPLGEAVGNAVEVIEAIETLKGGSTLLTTLSLSKVGGPADLLTVTFALASRMLLMGKLAKTEKQALSMLRQAIQTGAALAKFREMVKRQGGDERIVDDYSRLPQARYRISVPSAKSGWVKAIDTYRVGMLAVELGAGRKQITDPIDHAVGFLIHKKVGQKVAAGEALATVLANDEEQGREVAQQLQQCFSLAGRAVRPLRKILGELR